MHKSTLAGFRSPFGVKTCNWFLFAWQEVLQELCSRIWVGDEAGPCPGGTSPAAAATPKAALAQTPLTGVALE